MNVFDVVKVRQNESETNRNEMKPFFVCFQNVQIEFVDELQLEQRRRLIQLKSLKIATHHQQ